MNASFVEFQASFHALLCTMPTELCPIGNAHVKKHSIHVLRANRSTRGPILEGLSEIYGLHNSHVKIRRTSIPPLTELRLEDLQYTCGKLSRTWIRKNFGGT